MSHTQVSALMTTEVVTAREHTPFHEIAGLLADHRISAVPVVDADRRVVGVVSERDLLQKIEFADGADGAGLFERAAHRARRHKADGRAAVDLMTAPAVTVTGDVSVVKAARIMDSAGVKRLPVVDDDGRLAGIVSRADLLRVYLREDPAIHDEIVHDLLSRLWISPAELTVEVKDGVVRIFGEVEQRSMVDIVVRLIRATDGVVDVVQHITYRFDDTKTSEPRYYRPLV